MREPLPYRISGLSFLGNIESLNPQSIATLLQRQKVSMIQCSIASR
jgi:hypothetical protein